MTTHTFEALPDPALEAIAFIQAHYPTADDTIEFVPIRDAPLTRAERRRQERQPKPAPGDEVHVDGTRSLIAIVGNVIAVSTLLGRVVVVHPDGERDTIEGPFYRYKDGMDTVARIIAVARGKAEMKHG